MEHLLNMCYGECWVKWRKIRQNKGTVSPKCLGIGREVVSCKTDVPVNLFWEDRGWEPAGSAEINPRAAMHRNWSRQRHWQVQRPPKKVRNRGSTHDRRRGGERGQAWGPHCVGPDKDLSFFWGLKKIYMLYNVPGTYEGWTIMFANFPPCIYPVESSGT